MIHYYSTEGLRTLLNLTFKLSAALIVKYGSKYNISFKQGNRQMANKNYPESENFMIQQFYIAHK